MAITIDSTVSGLSANSYVTLAEANAYFALRPRSTVWEDADSEDKQKALLQAARILDTRVAWKGTIVNYEQLMAWPRHNVRDYTANDGSMLRFDRIPRWLKEAQYEQAFDILNRDTIAESESDGIASLSVGPISISYESGGAMEFTLPRPVRDLIQHYGDFQDGASSGTVPVVRS